MMNTTNKLFKQEVRTYITDSLSTDETSILSEQLQATVSSFKKWYSPYEQKQHPNRQDAFVYWLQCLPSELSVDAYYYDIEQILAKWFSSIDQPFKPKKHFDYATFFYRLIYREFCALCKLNNITF